MTSDLAPEISRSTMETMMARCACLNIRKAARAVTLLYDRALEPAGVLSTQLPLLVSVGLEGPVSAAGLAERVVMDRTAVSRSLTRLQEMGLVALRPGNDRRTREASLTPEGWSVIEKALPLWSAAQRRVMGSIGRREFDEMIERVAAVPGAVRE